MPESIGSRSRKPRPCSAIRAPYGWTIRTTHKRRRYLLLGVSIRDRVLVVAFVERHSRVRLISARRATRRERSQYEEET